ncbi:MAG: lysophospholipid acyltransferase family protein [Candidatus Omnitrophica bacterium]|nr:lysophospholipid acyltransferase family protein [Candidatus Omnitrophota bacterium]
MLYEILKSIGLFIFTCFFGLCVKGKKVFPRSGPFIVACNHISNLDPIVLGCACPRQLYYLAKEELFENKLFGLLLRNINVLPLKRGKSDIRIMRAALSILKTSPLALFPQGTRGANFDNFKAGVGFLYRKAKTPVIAAKISGTENILPKGAKFLKKGRITIIFDEVRNIKNEDTSEEVAQKVIEKIKSL